MRKTNKKLLLSLSVLATPFVVENLTNENVANANTQYTLTQNVKAYETAQNAAKQAKTNKTYSTGTYYVYKEHNGMINISKTQGKPGSWINPTNNKPAATSQTVSQTVTTAAPVKTQSTTPVKSAPKNEQLAAVEPTKQTAKQTVKNNTYTLNNSVKTYNNAAAAKSQKGAKSTYTSGNYFIFKEFNGMMNISRTAGRAGAWINPVDNKVLEAKTTTVSNTAQKPTEVVATPASTSVAPTTGTSQTKAVETVQQSNTKTTPVKDAEYILKSRTSVYNTSVDASNSINSTTTYDQGTYYVYKTYNGMVNISRTRGRAGAWINPQVGETSNVQTVTSTQGLAKSMPIASKKYTISSPYGVSRYIPSLGLRDVHDGVDFVTANKREPILATEDGVVERAGRDGTGAERIIIKHGENSYTGYWHLARNSLTVKPGDFVKAGQQIGIMGSTGWSTGIHLHFMHSTTINMTKSHKDPMKYLKDVK